MSLKEVCVMSQRSEFVVLGLAEGSHVSELCRRFGVSRKTGDKWLAQDSAQANSGLSDRSRRPKELAVRTNADVEGLMLVLRREHPAWRGRKVQCVRRG